MALHVKRSLALISLSLLLWQPMEPAAAQETIMARKDMASLNWLTGPRSVLITERAEITLPEGYVALSSADTARVMQLMQIPTTGEGYYVGPEDKSWYVVFSYQDTGHVPETQRIEADALLASLRASAESANAERLRRGSSRMRIRGWKFPPSYDSTLKRLTWAIEEESDGAMVVNYHARMLSRTGVMSAAMVVDSAQVDSAVKEFQGLLGGYRFLPGSAYADFRAGDKVSPQGLAALIADVASAVAAEAEPEAEPQLEDDTGNDSTTLITAAIVIALLVLGGLAGWFLGGRR